MAVTGKLIGKELKLFAEGEGSRRERQVIVEVEGGLPKIRLTAGRLGQGPRRKFVYGTGKHGKPAYIDRMDEVADLLEKITHKKPKRLSAARSFVVAVTATQLREIAQSNLVSAVRDNRSHRLGAPVDFRVSRTPKLARTPQSKPITKSVS